MDSLVQDLEKNVIDVFQNFTNRLSFWFGIYTQSEKNDQSLRIPF